MRMDALKNDTVCNKRSAVLRFIAVFCVLAYTAVVFHIYTTQDEKIFFPQHSQIDFVLKEGMKEVFLEVDEDVVLEGRYFNGAQNSALIIYFGGNADNAKKFLQFASENKNYDILTINYRGYGSSGGVSSQDAIFADALKIYDHFAKDKDVVAIGRSLGSGVATYLASQREVKGLILITPYDSIYAMAKDKYPYLPIRLLLKHQFDSTAYIGNTSAQIGVIEVENDLVVPNKYTHNLIQYIKRDFLHELLQQTTHGEVINHPEFNRIVDRWVKQMIGEKYE